MAKRVITAVLATSVLLIGAPVLLAQSNAGRVTNPEAVEFDVPTELDSGIDGYRVEVFRTGSNTKSADAVKALEFSPTAAASEGKLRVEIRSSLEGLPDGEYLATIRTLRSNSQSARSEPTQPFLVSHGALAQDRVIEQRERFWRKVGIAIGAGVMIIPFLVP